LGWVPLQVPEEAARGWPSCVAPEIVGRLVFVGAIGLAAVVVDEELEPDAEARDATTGVGAEVAAVEPLLFVAMTVTRKVLPTSAEMTT